MRYLLNETTAISFLIATIFDIGSSINDIYLTQRVFLGCKYYLPLKGWAVYVYQVNALCLKFVWTIKNIFSLV